MTATAPTKSRTAEAARPRFGGVFWRMARVTSPLTIGLAGKRWNPIWAIVEHVGRRTGRRRLAPVAARRTADGFVVALAFGAQVDWYRNLVAAGGGTIGWRGRRYPVGAPVRIDPAAALATFHPIQRFFLRIVGVDGYVRIPDAEAAAR